MSGDNSKGYNSSIKTIHDTFDSFLLGKRFEENLFEREGVFPSFFNKILRTILCFWIFF